MLGLVSPRAYFNSDKNENLSRVNELMPCPLHFRISFLRNCCFRPSDKCNFKNLTHKFRCMCTQLVLLASTNECSVWAFLIVRSVCTVQLFFYIASLKSLSTMRFVNVFGFIYRTNARELLPIKKIVFLRICFGYRSGGTKWGMHCTRDVLTVLTQTN